MHLHYQNSIGSVMLNLLASSAVDRDFEPRSCQTKDKLDREFEPRSCQTKDSTIGI